MSLNDSKLFESNILNSTTGNNSIFHFNMDGTHQEKRRQQSQAMFSELNKNQYQKCEEDYVKNQDMLRKYFDKQNEFTKSNVTGEPALSFGLLFSPTDGLEFSNSPDENASTRDEIFVFNLKNIEKIAQSLNLNYDKLKDLFVKIINDEDVNEEFLSELNSKMSVDENVTLCDRIDLQNAESASSKNPVFNQSTQTNDQCIEVRTSYSPQENNNLFNESIQTNRTSINRNNRLCEHIRHPNHEYTHGSSPQTQERKSKTRFKDLNTILDPYTQANSTLNCEFIQVRQPTLIKENHFSNNLSHDSFNMSSQLLNIVDGVLAKNKPTCDVLSRNTNCSSPDLFSDLSEDDCIPPS